MLADHLFAQVRAEGRSIRTLSVKVRYNDRAEDQANASLAEPTDLETEVYGRLHTLLRQAWKRRVSVRAVFLKLSNVYDGRFRRELPLDPSARRRAAQERLAGVIDELRRTRGHAVIRRAHDFRLALPPGDAVTASPRPASAPIRRRTGSARLDLGVYVPLRVYSHYSFLDSTLAPAALVDLARQRGLSVLALTDTGNLHGAVEFVAAARAAGVKPILGVELRGGDHPLLLYVESAIGYHHLCRLLSRHAERTVGEVDEASVVTQQRRPFRRDEFDGLSEGLIAVSSDVQLADRFPGRFYRLVTAREMSADFPAVAGPAVHYATSEERRHYDILQSIRTLTLLRQEHPEKRAGGRFHFRSPAELAGSCRDHPDWLRHTREIAERCEFALPFGKPQFPAFVPPDGSTASEFLRRLVEAGARRRYRPAQLARLRAQIDEELAIINEVGYAEYFLITWDLLQECRRRAIQWITRGSAADSLVCYCLGISGVCPVRFDLYFRRFLNRERMALHKLPDIDVDFPHDRKDDVAALLFEKYGREHCAVVGGFSTFQARSAFAEVAKVLGVAEREVRKFTEHFPWGFGGGWVPDEPAPQGGRGLIELLRANPETRDLPLDEEPYRTALHLAARLDGVPRYPKMHPCGVVLSRPPISTLTPLLSRIRATRRLTSTWTRWRRSVW